MDSKKEISFQVNIDIETLAWQITNECSHDELIDFIKEIDYIVGEWEFTLELVNHFADLKAQYDEEWA